VCGWNFRQALRQKKFCVLVRCDGCELRRGS
jgi:hypothetical protein